MKYPNYECGECPAWLAYDPPEISLDMIIKSHCSKCELYLENFVDCDGRCLNCDEYDAIRGCTREEE